MTENRYAVLSGNIAMAMGGAAAGVKFYCAYPMSPSTGVLHWMAAHARKAGIMVRQVEDEIGVVNMAIGAAHAGVRAMCATSGGGFALMSEGLGMSAMMETRWWSSIASAPARPPGFRPRPSKAISGRCWAPRSATIPESSPRHSTLEIASSSSRRCSISPTASSVRASSCAICLLSEGQAQRRSQGLGLSSRHRSRRADHQPHRHPGPIATAPTSATRSPRAAFRRARFPAFPATPTRPPPTSTMRTAC